MYNQVAVERLKSNVSDKKNCSVFLFYCCAVFLTIGLQVLDCSALAPDLTLLPAGDKTQIGEQGVGFFFYFFAFSHHMILNTKGYQFLIL